MLSGGHDLPRVSGVGRTAGRLGGALSGAGGVAGRAPDAALGAFVDGEIVAVGVMGVPVAPALQDESTQASDDVSLWVHLSKIKPQKIKLKYFFEKRKK